MIIISHRGNTAGPNPSIENNPTEIQKLLNKGINVEIDVWSLNGSLYTGHDVPKYPVSKAFITQQKIWCHAKNLAALPVLMDLKTICFWHQNDDYTLTTNNYIWAYPNKQINERCIIVDLTKNWRDKNYNCAGVCVDYL